jgi:nucleotide-binding universal stress UspA family protein
MFTSILVPLDGSHLAERSLDVAVPIAQAGSSSLHLVMVRSKPLESNADADRSEDRYLKSVAERTAQQVGRSPVIELLSDSLVGIPMSDPPARVVAELLQDYVRTHGIDLTVMSTHGRGGLTRVCIGSVADAFVRYGPSPTLVFQPDGKRVRASRIVVLLDGTPEAERIVRPALNLCEASNARCTLLRVVSEEAGRESAELDLQQAGAAFGSGSVLVDTAVVVAHDVPQAVLKFAMDHCVDVIALTTRTTNPLRRAFLGSVADALVRGGGRPVLICNPFTALDESRGIETRP